MFEIVGLGGVGVAGEEIHLRGAFEVGMERGESERERGGSRMSGIHRERIENSRRRGNHIGMGREI